MLIIHFLKKYLTTLGRYILLMKRSLAIPDRMHMFVKRYTKDVAVRGRFDSDRALNFFLHWGCDLHSDEGKHRKSMDASLGGRIHDAGDHAS